MKLLIDENMDARFPGLLPTHSVGHVIAEGWRGISNGALFDLTAASGFDVFITADKNMPYQQSMVGRSFALVVLDVHPNNLDNLAACLPAIHERLKDIRAGEVYVIEGPHPKRNS